MESEHAVGVLLVDDQPSNLLALEAILGGLRLDLVRARSGEEALMRVLDADFAVILMDVQMPGMDGFEAATLIRQRDRSRQTPIIFLTAFQADDVQVSQGYALGAVDFLSKPVVPTVLRSKVAVFVELFEKTEQVRRQADELCRNQRRDHERDLVEEKRRWELEWLRAEAAREKKRAEESQHKAEELSRTVAERARAEEELGVVRDALAAQLADMTRLHALGARLSNNLELATVLEEVLAAVTGLQGADRGVLMLLDRGRDVMVTAAVVGFDAGDLDAAGVLDAVVPVADVMSAVLDGGRVVEDARDLDDAFAPHLPAALRDGCRAVCGTPLLTTGGKLVGTIAAYFPRPYRPTERAARLVDLYARQAAEFIDNARLYREIQEADRHKDEFLAMLAHELRNPLSPLLNALYLLAAGDLDDDDAVEALRVADRQVRQLARLVDDLLDVSRIGSGKIQLRIATVDLHAVVARAVEAVRPLIQDRRHELSVALSTGPLALEADAARLEQVLANLLNNAAKYTEPGGRIELDARRDPDAVVVRVRDTGIGIAPELLPRIFDLFTQAERSLDRSQGGLGIGLTLVHRLVELHGGSVAASSAGVGRGSEFTVRLPAGRATPADPPDSRDPTAPGARSAATPDKPPPKRVLVVEDNVDGARLLVRLLRACGHDAESVPDGPAALEAAVARPPDVVLLDIGLPGMDGYEVARRLDGLQLPGRPLLVALSGYGREDDLRRSRDAGIDLHLVKPVDPQALRELLDRPPPIA